jgi:hypothetical protein
MRKEGLKLLLETIYELVLFLQTVLYLLWIVLYYRLLTEFHVSSLSMKTTFWRQTNAYTASAVN